LHSIIGKHEDTISKMHSYMMENNSKLSLAERSLVKHEMEIKHLKNVESRYVHNLSQMETSLSFSSLRV
jgi:hypothetical protein